MSAATLFFNTVRALAAQPSDEDAQASLSKSVPTPENAVFCVRFVSCTIPSLTQTLACVLPRSVHVFVPVSVSVSVSVFVSVCAGRAGELVELENWRAGRAGRG